MHREAMGATKAGPLINLMKTVIIWQLCNRYCICSDYILRYRLVRSINAVVKCLILVPSIKFWIYIMFWLAYFATLICATGSLLQLLTGFINCFTIMNPEKHEQTTKWNFKHTCSSHIYISYLLSIIYPCVTSHYPDLQTYHSHLIVW